MEPENKNNNIEVETFAKDMAREIENASGDFIKKIVHEQEANEEKKKDLSIKTKKNQIFVYLGLAFLFLAIISLVLLSVYGKKIKTLDVAPQYVPLIFSDKNSTVPIDDLNKYQVAKIIAGDMSATNVKPGGIEAFYLTLNNKAIGLRKFIELTEMNLKISNNNFVSDNFLLGVANEGTKDLFILIKVRSIPDIFTSMHDWENKMFSDLHGFWNLEITPDTAYLLTKDFEDGIMQNKNARILYDKEGKIVLAYVFIADDSVIVTNTEKATEELILRLSASKIKK